ncbi:uncharacterized protein [Chelonus insularis]|uniref:uncharacterized protein n=1 Tax=Chelonus insularis TaxID=460826 RepID=UPI00158B91C1|nr:uncharacterized protein LOC118071273 [Chelonus insularis]
MILNPVLQQHNALKRHLEFLGGCNVRDALHRYFQATMTPTLATNFTWTGKTKGNVEGKRILYKTKLVSIFFNVVKKTSNINQLTSDEWRSSCPAVLKSHKQIVLNMRNAAKKSTQSKKSRRNRREEENLFFPNLENPQPGPSTIADSESDSSSHVSDDNMDSEQ